MFGMLCVKVQLIILRFSTRSICIQTCLITQQTMQFTRASCIIQSMTATADALIEDIAAPLLMQTPLSWALRVHCDWAAF